MPDKKFSVMIIYIFTGLEKRVPPKTSMRTSTKDRKYLKRTITGEELNDCN